MIRNNLIFLVGFMGAGKSTIGPLLAHLLKWNFIDLDQEIEKGENRSISQIFQENGESYFRQLETQALQTLRAKGPSVVALGGGAFVEEVNRLLICQLGYSVFLDCPLEVIVARCPKDGTRPLLQSSGDLETLYTSRLPYYQKCDFRVDVSSQSPEQITKIIMAHLSAGRFDDAHGNNRPAGN
jgi:shikimate kinase